MLLAPSPIRETSVENKLRKKEIMTTDFPYVALNDTVESCMQLMTSHRLIYPPVIENKQLVGIVSINDLVTETILTQAETINQLQSYIQS